MISQLVFDLPLEGPFDYIVPSSLEHRMAVGMCVQVFLGTKKSIGIVIALQEKSEFEHLKPVKAVVEKSPVLDQGQMSLGHAISAYYGCSLGEALFSILRGSDPEQRLSSVVKKNSPALNLYVVPPHHYAAVLVSLIEPLVQKKQRVLVLVADQFAVSWAEKILGKHFSVQDYVIGTRSKVFRSLADIGLVIIVEEENSSFKQEQTPMYETRQVLLMRADIEQISLAFITTTPSTELMLLKQEGKVRSKEAVLDHTVKVQAVDLNNYKFTPKGLLSIPVKNAIERNLAQKEKTILVLNRKGAYALTRCTDCGGVLKCHHCDSPMTYSRSEGKYLCSHCTFTLPQETVCPVCRKPSWKSVGIGVEQLQKELKSIFPQAKVLCFERKKNAELGDFDVLIATQAVLRFRQQLKVNTIALIDIDSPLNRLQIRSSFEAWSLVNHLRSMAKETVLIQTRNHHHYVIQALLHNDPKMFYEEDINLRRELKLAPFSHDIVIGVRSKNQVHAQTTAEELYSHLKQEGVAPSPVEKIAKKRDQFRFMILVKAEVVTEKMRHIKAALSKIKRQSKVIVTLNVD